ncbi:MAG: class B sortase [Lachnospiraceae bacterium]|nr:class B sortase [Lachnospiraceae bacterium]
MAGFEVSGRRFRTESDYQAALRDQAKIEKIKSQVNMEQPGEVITLYADIGAGVYRFETVVGNDFDDEIYELAEQYKRQGYNKDSRLPSGKKKKDKVGSSRKEARSTGKITPSKEKKVSLDEFDKEMQKEILHELKKREKRRKLAVVMCSLVAVLCFGYFGIYYYFSDRTQANYEDLAELRGKGNSTLTGSLFREIHYSEDETIQLEILEEYQTLYSKNKKLIGWLKIDDTNIDYPVMQTANNEYYLDHNFNQEYDKNGSLFLDKDCDVVHRNTNLIIYGHHMKSGKMFGNLNRYSSEEYGKKHSQIQFDTIYEKGTYEVMYVFRSRIYNEDEVVFKYYQFFDAASEKEFDSNMQEMAALSLYDTGVTASYGDELLTLSTCDSSETDGRFVVVAKKVREEN